MSRSARLLLTVMTFAVVAVLVSAANLFWAGVLFGWLVVSGVLWVAAAAINKNGVQT